MNKAEVLPFKLFLDAVDSSAKRTRTVWVSMLVTCALILTGVLGSTSMSASQQRISLAVDIIKYYPEFKKNEKALLLGYEKTPDYKQAKEFYRKYEPFLENEEEARKFLSSIVQREAFGRSAIALPLGGPVLDTEDLSSISGIIFLVFLILLRYSVYREKENLEIAVSEAERREAAIQCLRLIKMKQVFFLPKIGSSTEGDGKLRSRLWKSLPVLLFFLPVCVQIGLSVWNFFGSIERLGLIQFFNAFLIFAIFSLTVSSYRLSRKMDDIWEKSPDPSTVPSEGLGGEWQYTAEDRQSGTRYKGSCTIRADDYGRVSIVGCRTEEGKESRRGEYQVSDDRLYPWSSIWAHREDYCLRFEASVYLVGNEPQHVYCDLKFFNGRWQGIYFKISEHENIRGRIELYEESSE